MPQRIWIGNHVVGNRGPTKNGKYRVQFKSVPGVCGKREDIFFASKEEYAAAITRRENLPPENKSI